MTSLMLDNKNHPARPQIDDHAMVVHHRIAIIDITRYRTHLANGRQRLTHDDRLLDRHGGRVANALDRRDHRIRNFDGSPDCSANGTTDDLADRTCNGPA